MPKRTLGGSVVKTFFERRPCSVSRCGPIPLSALLHQNLQSVAWDIQDMADVGHQGRESGGYQMTQQRWAYTGWLGITLICVFYAPMASEYIFRFYDFGSLRLWDRFYAMVVGEGQALGPGSAVVEQHDVYMQSRLPLLVHTGLGGILILLGAFQFSRGVRQRYPKAHRWAGRILVGLATISMFTAITYLIRTGPAGTFSGPAFHAQLWALAIGTLASVWAGFVAIRRREIELHQCLMAYAFALLLTAPLLRVLWLVLGLMWPDVTQEFLNVAGGTILGLLAPGGAIVASRVLDSRAQTPTTGRPMPETWLEVSIGVLALLSAAWLAIRFQKQIGEMDRLVITVILSIGAGIGMLSVMKIRARQQGKVLAAEEWRIHALALQGCLPLYALMWAAYAVWFTPEASFYSAALTAPALAMSAGFFLVLWRRWEPKSSMQRNPGISREQLSSMPTAQAKS
ncbi:MAG: DUF2306 domain-containing protein [Panacagrimonas sp.]